MEDDDTKLDVDDADGDAEEEHGDEGLAEELNCVPVANVGEDDADDDDDKRMGD